MVPIGIDEIRVSVLECDDVLRTQVRLVVLALTAVVSGADGLAVDIGQAKPVFHQPPDLTVTAVFQLLERGKHVLIPGSGGDLVILAEHRNVLAHGGADVAGQKAGYRTLDRFIRPQPQGR